MAYFLDIRYQDVGGGLAVDFGLFQGTELYVPGTKIASDYATILRPDLLRAIRGRRVLVGTHGFNVDRANGIDCLHRWSQLLQLPDPEVFIGVLWPGDSSWAHGLDYPVEPKIADETGDKLAPFLDSLLAEAASVSFASHSLGARVVLRTVSKITRPPQQVILMAGAIEDNCLTKEFKAAAAKVGEISVLASKEDDVLKWAFPLGNPVAWIIQRGHPWWHGALGRSGPDQPWPANFRAPYEIPGNWRYGHGSYLQVDPPSTMAIARPVDVPVVDPSLPLPSAGALGWQETWSSAFAATRFG